MTLDLAAGYEALRRGPGAVHLERDGVRVAGPDALSYLQGQLSQDLAALEVGATTWSLVLQPQGKVDALVRVTRTGEETAVLDTDAGWGQAVLERLARFKLRSRLELDLERWDCVRVVPADAPRPAPAHDELVTPFRWGPIVALDGLGAGISAPGVPEAGADAWEVVRIEAGVPVMGAELTERTIPAEIPGLVERAVSFTKGCFTGQELVARIDARGGHVPRRLQHLRVDGPPPPPGTAVLVEGRQAGAVTSSARHPAGHSVALALLGRDVVAPSEAGLDGGAMARIEAGPLLS